MSTVTNSHLLIAAQVYGGQGPAAKARRDTQPASEFTVELAARATDKRAVNPTLVAPGSPKPLEPAKRFDEGAGRRDVLPNTQKQTERRERPGSRLDILA